MSHPESWSSSGYHELTGRRQRYRVVNRRRLLKCLADPCAYGEFGDWYDQRLSEKLDASAVQSREALWTDCAAVGDRNWIRALAENVTGAQQSIVTDEARDGIDNDEASYGLKYGRRAERGMMETWSYLTN